MKKENKLLENQLIIIYKEKGLIFYSSKDTKEF